MNYRVKADVVEAFRFDNEPANWPDWFKHILETGQAWWQVGDESYCMIASPSHSDMDVAIGDYVVRDRHGRIYPVKPDAFASFCEPAD